MSYRCGLGKFRYRGRQFEHVIHDQVANVFPRRRNRDTAAKLRSGRTQAFATWADVTGVVMAA